jgi:predicted HAD superfamily Cof-like phosphohydrolase
MNFNFFEAVMEFHEKMRLSIGDPRSPNTEIDQALRVELIQEEFTELKDALTISDPVARTVEVADALADLAYVICGAAISWGIDLPMVFQAVHVSNITKTPDNKRQDGKIMKGPKYQRPQIAEALTLAAEEAEEYGLGIEDGFWPCAPNVEIISPEAQEDPSADTDNRLTGTWTSYGALVFDCPCGRTHAVQGTLGTRGGIAPQAKAECMCGRAFVVDFGHGKTATVTVTTIEDLRKAQI